MMPSTVICSGCRLNPKLKHNSDASRLPLIPTNWTTTKRVERWNVACYIIWQEPLSEWAPDKNFNTDQSMSTLLLFHLINKIVKIIWVIKQLLPYLLNNIIQKFVYFNFKRNYKTGNLIPVQVFSLQFEVPIYK